jgi:hypothetical protein
MRNLTEQDFKPLLKKGYKQFHNGNEYVYDFKLTDLPIVMKILSTVKVDPDKKGNKGSHQIRVFAVKCDRNGKITGGYIKAQRITVARGWRQKVSEAYVTVKKQVYVRARRERL